MTFGEKVCEAVREYLKANGLTHLGKINAKILAEIIDRCDEQRAKQSTVRLKPMPKDEVASLFSALCDACGVAEDQMTVQQKKTYAVMLNQLRGATPGLTPVDIQSRAQQYKKKYRDAALTAGALASHWGEFHSQASAKTVDVYQEAPNWRELVEQSVSLQNRGISDMQWNELPHHIKQDVWRMVQ